jgi:AcrR family transcriptional regulator
MPSERPAASPRGTRTVQRILDAAARLFGKEGYRGASMDAVARAAGVSKGLLHYHFQSKEHLLIEAQRLTFRQVHRRIEERVKRGEAGMPTALDGLDAIWSALRDMRAWAPFMVETMSLASQGGETREKLDAFYAETEGLLTDAIREVFRTELDQLLVPPERLARLVRIQVHGLVVELAYARDADALARIDQAYADLRRTFQDVAVGPRSAG